MRGHLPFWMWRANAKRNESILQDEANQETIVAGDVGFLTSRLISGRNGLSGEKF